MWRSFIWLTAILALVSSCKTEVETDFPRFDPVPVVNSILVAGKPVTVHLSIAEKLDSVPLTVIANAAIELFVDGKFTEEMENKSDGSYTSTTIVEPLKEYTCKIIIPDKDTLVCTQTLPASSLITKIKHINIAGRDEEGTTYPAVEFTFQNDTTKICYYEASIFTQYYDRWDSITVIQNVSFLNIDDLIILNEGLPMALFSNELITKEYYTLTLNYTTGGSSSSNGGAFHTTLYPFFIELRSVSADYYRYKKQYYLYENGRSADGLITTITAAPLYSNIENGYGIFAGYSVFTSDIITPEPYE